MWKVQRSGVTLIQNFGVTDFFFVEGPDTLDRLLQMVDFKRKVEVVDLSSEKVTATNLVETKINCLVEEKVRQPQTNVTSNRPST